MNINANQRFSVNMNKIIFVSYVNNGMKCTGDKSTRGYILFRAYKDRYNTCTYIHISTDQ